MYNEVVLPWIYTVYKTLASSMALHAVCNLRYKRK